jgi:hypothetical protein
MGTIYRTPLLVKRKQPFVEWLRSLDDADTFDEAKAATLMGETDVFLVHVPEQEPTLEELIAEYWQDVFEEQLWAWMTDELTWPPDRTREMFDAWFDVHLGIEVVDLVPDEPLTDDDVDAAYAEAVMRECAWCGTELEDVAGRMIGFAIDRPERLAHRAARVLSIVINRDRVAMGIVTPLDSELAAAGKHVLYKTCSRDCERALKSAVPRALRKAMQSIPDVH